MDGKKVIITGVPGVGKTTVVNEALKKSKKKVSNTNRLTSAPSCLMLRKMRTLSRTETRCDTLDRAVQKRLQQRAAQAIAQIPGNVLIDTHASVKTPNGFLAGLPEWVLREIMPDLHCSC